MASRYGVLIRSARSSVQTSFRRSSSAVRTPFPGRTRIPLRNDTDNAAFRRRFSYISRLPVELGCALHSAVADAKLVSHLSVNSRTCSALSLGLQGYMNATLCTVPARNPSRSTFQSSFRRRSSAAGNPLAGRTRNPSNNTPNAASRRRFSNISRLPFELGCALHNAVADARLISHLAVNSRTCNTVSLGLRGYINAALPNVRRTSVQLIGH